MAKVQIKSEKLTPFGGIFSIMEQFDALLAQTIESSLGLRCTMFGYQYSEILRSLMCVYLCGGSCIEDVTTHLMKHLSEKHLILTESRCRLIQFQTSVDSLRSKLRSPGANEPSHAPPGRKHLKRSKIHFLFLLLRSQQ